MASSSGKKQHLAFKKKIVKFKASGKGTRTEWAEFKRKAGLPKYQKI